MDNKTLSVLLLLAFMSGLLIGYAKAHAQDASSGYADNGEAYARGKGE